MTALFRSSFSEVIVTLTSDETLGILDTDYLEDYDGIDGQVSIYHPATDTRYPMPMSVVASYTPDISFDRFEGSLPLAALPDGDFQVQGRCRDRAGNYTIVNAFSDPDGNEQIVNLPFEILPGNGVIHQLQPCFFRHGTVKRSPLVAETCRKTFALSTTRRCVRIIDADS